MWLAALPLLARLLTTGAPPWASPAFAQPGPRSRQSQPPRGRRVALAAEALGGSGPRTWRQAQAEAKALEEKLRGVTESANKQVKNLDNLFTEADMASLPEIPAVPQKAPRNIAEETARPKRQQPRDPSANSGSFNDFLQSEYGGFFDKPVDGRDRNLEENPPILAFDAKGLLVGRFSSKSELPARVYPAQLTGGVVDDPSATAEENALWKEALELSVETLEQLWPAAESAVASVAFAEVMAEERRPSSIEEWRARVMEAITSAFEDRPEVTVADIERWLEIMRTDKRMLRSLALLEDSVLEYEGCYNELKQRSEEALKLPPKSDDFRRKMRRAETMNERIFQSFVDIRTICESAGNLVETDAAFKEIGDAFANLNPFR